MEEYENLVGWSILAYSYVEDKDGIVELGIKLKNDS